MMRRIACLAAMLATVGLATAARASWPCGIYARIDKVEFEPNAEKPERIKVWGDFLMVKTSNRLVGPERGYMYFSLVEKKAEQCRIEWKDLQEIAGTKTNFVALGSAFTEIKDDLAGTDDQPNVHKKADKDVKPIPYPLNHGLSRLRPPDGLFPMAEKDPVAILQKYLDQNPLPKP
jgi:hypothetical protein